MQIQTYYSSQTESLIESLLFQLESDETSPINSPFTRATILVPNSGMQRYLELKIAERFGICAHIDIGYVGQLVSQTYKNLLDNACPAHLDERLLIFGLLRLWHKKITPLDTNFDKIFRQHKQSRQRYLFASKVARLLRQYLNDRPEMIDMWMRGKIATHNEHESWQHDVLSRLFSSLGIVHNSRLELQQRFIEALKTETAHDLPNIVHVFGFHAIPAAQLTDLLAIGQATQVVFYTFNPCIEYWLDIVPEKIKSRLEIEHEDEAALLTVGHPLLASWGQSGKFFIERLNEYYAPNLDEIVVPMPAHSVLTWLQNDIRTLNGEQGNEDIHEIQTDSGTEKVANFLSQELEKEQLSVSLHACANPRREVEVLYDNLCHAFESRDLNPADVLVIVPKLGDYAPHIQAVFSRNKDHISIPYSLANQSSAEAIPDVQAFLSLLNVLDGNFQAQLLFEVLSEARIQEALDISQSHLDNVRNWFVNSRFSLHFQDINEGKSSSLEKLIDSLILAAVGGEDAELGNRHASSLYHGGQGEPLSQFCALTQYFKPFVDLKNQTLTLSEWRDKLRQLTKIFLPPKHDMDAWINDWHDALEAIDGTKYDFATIVADLSTMLQSDTLHGPFLSGGVSFCAVVPMRGVPAKMIAILGLDNDFPNIVAKDPLDLRLDKPLWSDKNTHKEQQYFFLETLMAARESLYLSYIGVDEKTGGELPPSALVSELLGYLARYVPNIEKRIKTRYPIQGFVSEHSYQTLYTTPDNSSEASQKVAIFDEPTIALPDTLTVNALADILLEPLKAYFRYHLGAKWLDNNLAEPLAEYEFVAIDDGLDKWRYKESALEMALNDDNGSKENIISSLQNNNFYAPDVISHALLSQAQEEVAPLVDALKTIDLSTPQTINETIKVATLISPATASSSIYLRIKADIYPDTGILTYMTSKHDAKRWLRAWLTHAVYHALPDVKPQASLLLAMGKKGEIERNDFVAIDSRDKALCMLEKTLNLAQEIITTPYPVILKQSGKKADTILNYEATEYPLYSSIAPADEALVEQLQAFWNDIEEVATFSDEII